MRRSPQQQQHVDDVFLIAYHQAVQEVSIDIPVLDAFNDDKPVINESQFQILAGGSESGKDLLVEQPGFSYNIMRRLDYTCFFNHHNFQSIWHSTLL